MILLVARFTIYVKLSKQLNTQIIKVSNMNNVIKTIALFALTIGTFQAFAQEHGRGDTVLTRGAFHDGVTTVDSLNIDADINVDGSVFMQRSANGSIATITLDTLDAAAVQLDKKVRIEGDTHVGDEGNISEANIYLTGDMGTVNIESNYKREGKIVVGARASLNVGNIIVQR